jgi:hypothetical protein
MSDCHDDQLSLFGYRPTQPAFDGRTYLESVDHDRLRNATQRVLVRLLDGEWHDVHSLRAVGGAAYDSRIRDLRKSRFGGFVIVGERDPDRETLFRYRLDVETVTLSQVERVMNWEIMPDVDDADTYERLIMAEVRRLDAAGRERVLAFAREVQ